MLNKLISLDDTCPNLHLVMDDLLHTVSCIMLSPFQLSTNKYDGSAVTDADVKIQHLYNKTLPTLLHDSTVLGEESFAERLNYLSKHWGISRHEASGQIKSEYRALFNTFRYIWITDPIDGTDNFSKGKPGYCTSFILLDNGYPEYAMVYSPDHIAASYARTFRLEAHNKVIFNGKILIHTPRPEKKLSDAIISIYRSSVIDKDPVYTALEDVCCHVRYHELGVSGQLKGLEIIPELTNDLLAPDIYIKPPSPVEDVLPMAFIVQTYGYKATYLDGSDIFPFMPDRIMIDPNGKQRLPGIVMAPEGLHTQLMTAIHAFRAAKRSPGH